MTTPSFDAWAESLAEHIHKKQKVDVPKTAASISTIEYIKHLKGLSLQERRVMIAHIIDASIVWNETPEGSSFLGRNLQKNP